MNADGSGLRNLTRTPSNDLDPVWSPDGRAIAFVRKIQTECAPSARDTPCHNYETYLYVVNGDGSGLRRLTTHRAHLFNQAGRRTGRRSGTGVISCRPTAPGRRSCLGTSRRRGGRPTGSGSPSRWWTAALAGTNRRPTPGLRVMNADGRNPRRVARNAASSDPAWSPDGRRIAFRRFDRLAEELRPLCRERRRERAATADAPCSVRRGARPSLVCVVTRRADDRLPARPGGVHRESRRKRGTEAHAAQRIVEGQSNQRGGPGNSRQGGEASCCHGATRNQPVTSTVVPARLRERATPVGNKATTL